MKLISEQTGILFLGAVLGAIILGNIFGAAQLLETQAKSTMTGTILGFVIGLLIALRYLLVNKHD